MEGRMPVAGRTAVIFRGSGAVGSAVARVLAREGARMFIGDRNADRLERIADHIYGEEHARASKLAGRYQGDGLFRCPGRAGLRPLQRGVLTPPLLSANDAPSGVTTTIEKLPHKSTVDDLLCQSPSGVRSSSALPLPSMANGTDSCMCAIFHLSRCRCNTAVERNQRLCLPPLTLTPDTWRSDHATARLPSTSTVVSPDLMQIGPCRRA